MYVLNLIAINIPDCPYLEQYSIQHSIQYCHIDKNGNTNLLICYESELIKSKWLEIINNIINERNQYLTKKLTARSNISSHRVTQSMLITDTDFLQKESELEKRDSEFIILEDKKDESKPELERKESDFIIIEEKREEKKNKEPEIEIKESDVKKELELMQKEPDLIKKEPGKKEQENQNGVELVSTNGEKILQ